MPKDKQLKFEVIRLADEHILAAATSIDELQQEKRVRWAEATAEINRINKDIRESKDDLEDALGNHFGKDSDGLPMIEVPTQVLVGETLVIELKPKTTPAKETPEKRKLNIKLRGYDALEVPPDNVPMTGLAAEPPAENIE